MKYHAHAAASDVKRRVVSLGHAPTARWYRARCGDRVGVLRSSRRFGERFLGFDTPAALGLPFGTHATQLQVAVRVLAGWGQRGARTGIHFVEDPD